MNLVNPVVDHLTLLLELQQVPVLEAQIFEHISKSTFFVILCTELFVVVSLLCCGIFEAEHANTHVVKHLNAII